jgi:hypothetical protein
VLVGLDEASGAALEQVAIIRPSSCQTVRRRAQSPASRQTAQDSTSSRISLRESASPAMAASLESAGSACSEVPRRQ